MKRLFWLALFGAAVWYGWHHWGGVFGGSRDSEAVIVNSATHAMQRVRLTVDGQTFVRDAIEPEAQVTLPFRVARSSDFRLRWEWRGVDAAPDWRGGQVEPGPTRTRCTLQVFDDGGVVIGCVPMPTAPSSH
jgi:hypothetical protein